MKIIPAPFIYLFLLASALAASPGVKLITGKDTSIIPFELHGEEGRPFDVSRSGLQADDQGLIVARGNKGGHFEVKAPDRASYHFAADLVWDSAPPAAIADVRQAWFQITLNQTTRSGYPSRFAEFRLEREKHGTGLAVTIIPSADTARTRVVRCPISLLKNVRVEMAHRFIRDSVHVTIKINGKTLLDFSDFYALGHDEFALSFPNVPDAMAGMSYRVMNPVLSDRRIYPTPPAPDGLYDTLQKGLPLLLCDSFKTAYQGETPAATRWQVQRLGDSIPFFDELAEEPAFFYKCRIPFVPDSGTYLWRVRFRNNFNEWGPWSDFCTYRVQTPAAPFYRISDIGITRIGGRKSLEQIRPGQWLHLHVKIAETPASLKDLGYMVVFFSHPEYPFGHPGNKGGKFIRAKNSAINLSFYRAPRRFIFVEKRTENSFSSENVPENGMGLYVDGRTREIKVDTADRAIMIKFKLPPEALPSPGWIVSGYLGSGTDIYYREGRDRISPIFKKKISVLPRNSLLDFVLSPLPLLLLPGIWIAWFLLNRRRRNQREKDRINPRMKADWDKLNQWIDAHTGESKLYADQIRESLGFSRRYYYQLLAAFGIKTPADLINEIRIEKSKKLLLETNRQITDIAFEVGFTDVSYFGKLFKAKTGLSPKDFRNQAGKTS